MPIHHFVRLLPTPGPSLGFREVTVGSTRLIVDVGWALTDESVAAGLRRLFIDAPELEMLVSMFDVRDVEYPERLPDWSISRDRPADTEYVARLNPVADNEFRVFAFGGHVFTADTEWQVVTKEQAEFLELTPSRLTHEPSPPAFLTRAKRPTRTAPTRSGSSGRVDAGPRPSVASANAATTAEPSERLTSSEPDLDHPLCALGRASEGRVLAALRDGPHASSEIARALGRNPGSGSLKRLLAGLVERRAIELTIPHKPSSCEQKYRLVEASVPASVARPGAEARVVTPGGPGEPWLSRIPRCEPRVPTSDREPASSVGESTTIL